MPEEDNDEEVLLLEGESDVADGVPAADEAVYRPPKLSHADHARATSQSVLDPTPDEIAAACRTDQSWRALKGRLDRVEAQPIPTKEAIAEAWQTVISSYWIWANMAAAPLEKELSIEAITAEMKIREVQMKKRVSLRKIHALRSRMGEKFRNLA